MTARSIYACDATDTLHAGLEHKEGEYRRISDNCDAFVVWYAVAAVSERVSMFSALPRLQVYTSTGAIIFGTNIKAMIAWKSVAFLAMPSNLRMKRGGAERTARVNCLDGSRSIAQAAHMP